MIPPAEAVHQPDLARSTPWTGCDRLRDPAANWRRSNGRSIL